MSQQHPLEKVSIDVVKRNDEFFAKVGVDDSCHSLGPTRSRDEIYNLIFGFISDLRLISELERKRNALSEGE